MIGWLIELSFYITFVDISEMLFPANLQKNLRKNPKFILSYKGKIFIDFYM